MAGKQRLKPSYLLSKKKALEIFPMLKKEKLVGALVYYDGKWLTVMILLLTILIFCLFVLGKYDDFNWSYLLSF